MRNFHRRPRAGHSSDDLGLRLNPDAWVLDGSAPRRTPIPRRNYLLHITRSIALDLAKILGKHFLGMNGDRKISLPYDLERFIVFSPQEPAHLGTMIPQTGALDC